MRMRELREQSGLKQSLVAQNSGIDVPTLSRIETGKVLPTPLVLRRICEMLYQKPLDIYEKHEIDLIGCMGISKGVDASRKRGRGFVPKVQFKRSQAACKLLQRDVLRSLGYETAQQWFDECIEALADRLKGGSNQ